jgi:phytoene dehydrogenase-like protein
MQQLFFESWTKMSKKYDYDVVIVGAGVSGLVCGCYLAKAGLKTLIVEKNQKPGGYCTSFARNGFHFDACVHSLGSCGENGNITKVLKDLELDTKLKLRRFDPSDIIITPDHKVSFFYDLDKTIQDFQNNFPKEAKNIKSFFNYIVNLDNPSYALLRDKTFNNVLDNFISDKKLRAILSFPLLGNAGLSPSLISAFSAIKLYKEFMLDGGYYPKGEIQDLPDALAKKFKEYGGSLLLLHLVNRINIENNAAKGITLKNDDFISSKYVVSNCDVMNTFFELLKGEANNGEILNKLSKMEPSLSMFILYLGFSKDFKVPFIEGCNTWFLPHYDIENMYRSAKNRSIDNLAEYMIHIFPGKKSASVFVNAHFEDRKYWDSCSNEIADKLIKKIEGNVKDLSDYIVHRETATPNTLYRRTLNYKGASYGWAQIPSQFSIPGLTQVTSIANLYLTGHWTTLAQGIGGVAYLGYDTAKLILKDERIRE